MSERRRRVEHVKTSGSKYEQLEAVGEAMGFAPQRGLETTLKVDGTECRVALRLNSGTVVGSTFRASFEGPPAPAGPTLLLRRETAVDLTDKEGLVSVEVQVGDADFDLEVYLDSTAAEPEVRRFLSNAESRKAARWLIDRGFESLRVDRDGVTGTTTQHPAAFHDVMPQVFDALIALSKAGPLRGEVVKPPGGIALGLASLAAMVSAFFFFGTLGSMKGMQCFSLTGLGLGLLAYVLVRPLAQRVMAGHSASGSRARYLAALVGISVGCLSVFGVLTLLR